MKAKAEKTWTDRLLSIPGIEEAIELVKDHAWGRALDEVLEAGTKGEMGDEFRRLLTEETDNPLANVDKFFRNELVDSFVSETTDSWLEALAVEAGPKIAELWDLSGFAGERLVEMIYNPAAVAKGSYFSPLIFVAKTKKPEVERLLCEKSGEFSAKNALIGPPGVMRDGHIYLDVTHLPYNGLRQAYEAVLFLRDCLQIRSNDLREGAPESIDTRKALRCVELADMGKSSKEIAKEVGFRIYTQDNPSGSYPLFRKYLKRGHEIAQRLQALDRFLDSVSFSD